MRVAVLYTGGKDSTFAMYRAIQQGREITCLITLKSENPSSYMFHTSNIELIKTLHTKALGVPIVFKKTKGVKEEELKDLKAALQLAIKKYKIEGVVIGAVASEYQRYRVETVCADLGLRCIAPLWHLDPEVYISEFIKEGFKAIFSSVSVEGMGEAWLGRVLDAEALADLKKLNAKFGVHIGGEGGEFETFVLDGPIFKKKIEIQDAEKIWKEDRGVYLIKKAKLTKK
jgi:ABC transporter with metal-binding/Fe-S-binding domain ATP-binding protein